MSANTWLVIAIVFFAIAGILFIASILMFIFMNVPAIIGDLTGRTLAKGIQNIREENASINDKNARVANRHFSDEPMDSTYNIRNEYSDNPYNKEGQLLAHSSKRLDSSEEPISLSSLPPTDTLSGVSYDESDNNDLTDVLTDDSTDVLKNDESIGATEVLNQIVDEKTDMLSVSEPTDILTSDENDATTILSNNDDTMVLSDNKDSEKGKMGFVIIRRVSITHCNEVI